jgi:hypothetical protein
MTSMTGVVTVNGVYAPVASDAKVTTAHTPPMVMAITTLRRSLPTISVPNTQAARLYGGKTPFRIRAPCHFSRALLKRRSANQ